MKCMTFKMVGTLHIIVHGDKEPTHEDWTLYMRAVINEERRGVDVSEMRTLVFSDGGGPNAAQRKIASDVLKGRTTPIAIVTANSFSRGVITALRWFNPQCRAFAPEALGDALKFLGVPLTRYDMIVKVARGLQKELLLPKLNSLDNARLSECRASSVMM